MSRGIPPVLQTLVLTQWSMLIDEIIHREEGPCVFVLRGGGERGLRPDWSVGEELSGRDSRGLEHD